MGSDYKNSLVPIDDFIIEQAKHFIEKYSSQALCSLESTQLSTAMQLKNNVGLFISSDNWLTSLPQEENLPVQ
jgi:hypothetical protein